MPSPTRLLLPALLLALPACDLGKTGSQLVSEEVMVGTVLSTPAVTFSPAAALAPDAGFTVDGGSPAVTVPAQTQAFVFFGRVRGEQLTDPPSPLTDAAVAVEAAGTRVALDNAGSGLYQRSSGGGADGGFAYQSGADYRFVAERGGETFVGAINDAPVAEVLPELHPEAGYREQPAREPLVLTRPAPPAGTKRLPAFVVVFPVDASGGQGAYTYTNVPQTPLDFLIFVADPERWTGATLTLPGSAFPDPGQNYFVAVTTVKVGGPSSANLFLGSALLAGTADVGVVRTR